MNLILIFLGSSFWCFGVHVVVKNFLYEIDIDIYAKWDDLKRWTKIIIKPLFACPYCAASFHGTIIYFVWVNEGLFYWPVFCICLCGFNYLLSQFINE